MKHPQQAKERMTDIEDAWAKTWGETVSVQTAAQIFSVSRNTITAWVSRGYLSRSPQGKILVRAAARWANSAREDVI